MGHVWFAAMLVLVGGLVAVAWLPDDINQIRIWLSERRQENRRPTWAPGELPALTRELAGEREWQRRFWSLPQRYQANRHLRAAGYGAVLAGRARRLP